MLSEEVRRTPLKLSSSDHEPLISVIIPVYNTPDEYLRKCFESVIFQSYQNLEIIIVDDNSSDNSGDIADEYAKKDARVRVLHLEKNIFQYQARNMGVEIANGEWIHFIDCDDWIVEDTYKTLLSKLEPDTEAIFFGGEPFFELDDDSLDPKYDFYRLAYKKSDFQGTGQEYFVDNYNHSPAPWIMMFKKALFTDETRFYLDIINEDEVFMVRFLLRTAFVQSISDTLIFHTIRAGQVTRRKSTFANVLSVWVVAKEVLKELDNPYPNDVLRKLQRQVDIFYTAVARIYFGEIDTEERKKKSQLSPADLLHFHYAIEAPYLTKEQISILNDKNARLQSELDKLGGIKPATQLLLSNVKRRLNR